MASLFLPIIVLKAYGKQATSPAEKRLGGLAWLEPQTQPEICLDDPQAPGLVFSLPVLKRCPHTPLLVLGN